jgi:hypothetical protein
LIAFITAESLSSFDFSGKAMTINRIDIESINRTRKTKAKVRIQLKKKSKFSTDAVLTIK